MSPELKSKIIRSDLYVLVRPIKHRIDWIRWQMRGRPNPPPPVVKQAAIRRFGESFGLNILIETGTYLGDMIRANLGSFSEIYSVELDKSLHALATRRFAKYSHVKIELGDSAEVLPRLMASIRKPCLFWLDAHYSQGVTAKAAIDTPIARELSLVFSDPIKGHVVLIDDARCFNGQDGYPTMYQLQEVLQQIAPDYVMTVVEDVIRIYPRGSRV